MNELISVREMVVELVKKVGQFQLQHFRKMPERSGDRKAVRETVSFVDVESEKLLAKGLSPLMKDVGFYGEETGKEGNQDLVWIVDPLDGTTNYLNGIDHFSISVALVKKGVPILGVVYQPFAKDCFSCIRGQGVIYDGMVCQPPSPNVPVSDALFSTGFPYRSPDLAESFFKAAAEVLTLGLGIRRSGSAALDVAYVAMGWYQGFWESDLQPYDIAAGLLMMEENGVVFSNERGEDFEMSRDRILVAGFPSVHEKLLEKVGEAYRIV
jgi:myo-inositol-1(or 4)-monophosphatase